MITRAPRHTSLGDGVDPDVLSVVIPGAAAVHPRSVGVWPGGEIRAGFGRCELASRARRHRIGPRARRGRCRRSRPLAAVSRFRRHTGRIRRCCLRLGFVIFAVAVASVAMSRVRLGAHWPSDVIISFLICASLLLAAEQLLTSVWATDRCASLGHHPPHGSAEH